ncbi:MAG: hypothetical protein AAGF83_18320 [Cyanobacteria bacterium P01_G01_bin.67]
MFDWLNWFETNDCGLNLFIINWLGVEKESLLTDYEPIDWQQPRSVQNKTRC